jgi:hypothetical protein
MCVKSSEALATLAHLTLKSIKKKMKQENQNVFQTMEEIICKEPVGLELGAPRRRP